MTNLDQAELSEAATQGVCATCAKLTADMEHTVARLAAQMGGRMVCRECAREYRAGRLVQIDEGMRERVVVAVWNCGFHPGDVASGEAKRRIAEWPEDYAKACKRADAAIAAMGGAK